MALLRFHGVWAGALADQWMRKMLIMAVASLSECDA